MGVLGKDLFDLHRPQTNTKVEFGASAYWVEDRPQPQPYGTVLTEVLNLDVAPFQKLLDELNTAVPGKSNDILRAYMDMKKGLASLPLYRLYLEDFRVFGDMPVEAFAVGEAQDAFAEFMKTGGIPYVAVMDRTNEKIDQYLEGIYNTVIVKDIEQRQERREADGRGRKVTDISLLKTIARYLASVIGSPVSMKSITDYLISSGRKVSQNTVSDYVETLTESFVFYPVERFDIVGKQLLKINQKFYMVDMGIRNHILPRKRYDLGFTIENIVYLELSRRGYKVNIGKYGSAEVDFVTQKDGVITYYQVTADMTAEETFEREMRPLRSIQDNYEKIVLTLDRFSLGNYEGIKVVNVIDWLLA